MVKRVGRAPVGAGSAPRKWEKKAQALIRSLLVLSAAGILATLLGASCGRPMLPEGPPPEYERPRPIPWDAGPPPVDPFAIDDDGEGWVDDPGASPGAAGAPAG